MLDQACQCLGLTIAVRGLCEDRTDCNIYLNDVIGISNQLISQLASDDHVTSQQVLDATIAAAGPKFVQLLQNKMAPLVQTRSIIDTIDTARWRTPHAAIAAVPDRYRGVVIYLEKSPYLYAHVADVEVYSDGSGGASEPVQVYDLDKGTVLASYTFDNSSPGFKAIAIGKTFLGVRRLAVLYNAANVVSYEVDPYGMGYYQELCKPCACGTYASYAEFDSTQPVVYSARLSSLNPGMRIAYSLGCSLEPFICKNRAYFGHGFKYQVALELFNRIPASFRLNETTLMEESELNRVGQMAMNDLGIFLDNASQMAVPDCQYCTPCGKDQTKAFYIRL